MHTYTYPLAVNPTMAAVVPPLRLRSTVVPYLVDRVSIILEQHLLAMDFMGKQPWNYYLQVFPAESSAVTVAAATKPKDSSSMQCFLM